MNKWWKNVFRCTVQPMQYYTKCYVIWIWFIFVFKTLEIKLASQISYFSMGVRQLSALQNICLFYYADILSLHTNKTFSFRHSQIVNFEVILKMWHGFKKKTHHSSWGSVLTMFSRNTLQPLRFKKPIKFEKTFARVMYVPVFSTATSDHYSSRLLHFNGVIYGC